MTSAPIAAKEFLFGRINSPNFVSMKKYLISILTFHFSLITFHLSAQPKYEFRGVWVATVDNIDWPSQKYLSTDSQKIEFIKLLDMHRRNGMNAIIAQIRPATDAFYPSQYEPWSEWLTGTQGKPPVPRLCVSVIINSSGS